MLIISHLCISPKVSVRDWNVEVKSKAADDSAFHGNELMLLVCVITDVNEVIHAGWMPLLVLAGKNNLTELTPISNNVAIQKKEGYEQFWAII